MAIQAKVVQPKLVDASVMQKKDYQALAAFRYALCKFFKFSEEEASRYGVSMMEYEALLTICGFHGREEITIAEMAEWLQIRYRSAVDVVHRLELEHMVIRKKPKEDNFEVLVGITKKGRRMLEKLTSLNKQQLKR